MVAAASKVRKAAQPTFDAWTSYILRSLNKFAQQRTIFIFAALELLVGIIAACFYAHHYEVSHLGLGLLPSGSYLLLGILRALSAAFGLVAVVRRSPGMCRVYYCSFLANAVFGVVALIPILRLDCGCSNWKQCEALKAFDTVESPLIINFVEPPWASASTRKVPYQDPPILPQEAEIVSAGVPHTALLQQAASGGASERIKAIPQAASADRDAQGFLGTQLPGKRRGTSPEGKLEPFVESSTKAKTLSNATVSTDDSRELQLLWRWASSLMENHNLATGEPAPLQYFNVTGEGLAWVSSREPNCRSRRIVEGEKGAMHARWQKLRSVSLKRQMDLEIDPELGSQLWHCVVNHHCGVTSAEIYSDGVGLRVSFCELEEQVTPLVVHQQANAAANAKDTAKAKAKAAQRAKGKDLTRLQLLQSGMGGSGFPNETLEASVYFQRNGPAIREAQQREDPMGVFYRHVFAGTSTFDGMHMLSSLVANECRCGGQHPTCRTYYDATEQRDGFWCSIKEEMKQICLQHGVRLYWDKSKKFMWTEDICPTRCECSTVGMVPPPDAEALDTGLLWENRINYGSLCRRWQTTDAMPWCYVGWDSTCPDRMESSSLQLQSEDKTRHITLPGQYRSHLPCDKERQRVAKATARTSCIDSSTFVEFILIAAAICCVPHGVILFRFLSNRCGDEFKVEAQFSTIEDSDDAETSEDGGEDSPHKGNSRPSLADAFAGCEPPTSSSTDGVTRRTATAG